VNLIENGVDVHLLVDALVDFKDQRGKVAHNDFFSGVHSDKTRSGLQGFDRELSLNWRPDDADVYLGMVQIAGDVYSSDAEEGMDMRVAHLFENHFGEHFFEQGVESCDAIFRHSLKLLLEIGDLIGLQNISDFDVVEVLQQNPAFVSFGDVAHVFLDLFERGDRAFPDDLIFP